MVFAGLSQIQKYLTLLGSVWLDTIQMWYKGFQIEGKDYFPETADLF